LLAGDAMTRWSSTADGRLQQQQQQLLELCRRPDMRSLLDEISQQYEMHAGRHHYHHHCQQQHQQRCHDDVSSHDVNDTSSVMSLSDDEYASWFGWSAVDCGSSQHSSSKRFVI